MDLIESNTNSFIVKVWLEEANEATGRVLWRGHITHVPDGARRYVEDFEGINDFINLYLNVMDVEFGPSRRVALWFHRLVPHLKRKR